MANLPEGGPARGVFRRHRDAAAATLELARPVAGAAPGQLACLMDGDLVVGWGTICREEGPVRAAD